jgi:hypothetical protein
MAASSSALQKFSKVIHLVYALYTSTGQSTFEKLYLGFYALYAPDVHVPLKVLAPASPVVIP